MIQKRYKQTAKLAQAEALKATLENLPIILAEIPLPEIEDRPNHNQILRVRDVNVALCVNYIGIPPKRVLIHKVTKLEIETNLFVPKWEILSSTLSAQVNAEGEREMHEMEWFDDETNEAVTQEEVRY